MKYINKNILFLGWDQEYETTSIDAIESYTVERFVFPSFIIVIYKLIPSTLKEILLKILSYYISRKFSKFGVLIIPDNFLYYELSLKLRFDKKLMLIRNVIGKRERLLSSSDVIYYTFDDVDARKFKIKKYNQFLHLEKKEKVEEKYKVYYLGLVKDRKNEINNLIKALRDLNVPNLILPKERPQSKFDRIRCKLGMPKVKHKFVPYSENISYVNQSEIVVDIVNDGQSGLTLRVLEALFLNKKILTNNKNVMNYDFFDSRYIKVIDFENYDEICNVFKDKDFLSDNAYYDTQNIDGFKGSLVLGEIIDDS